MQPCRKIITAALTCGLLLAVGAAPGLAVPPRQGTD